jgi:hypothetical protein
MHFDPLAGHFKAAKTKPERPAKNIKKFFERKATKSG